MKKMRIGKRNRKRKQMGILDFDGPVVDSFEGAFMVARMITPGLTLEEYKARFQHNIHQVPGHLNTRPTNPSINFDVEYDKYMQQVVITPAKRNALIELSQHFHLHIVSGTHTDTLNAFLERNRLDHLFTDVLGYDFAKSKVERFNYLFEAHNTPASEAVFITDTTGDIMEAHKVSMGTIIAVCDGFHDRDWLLEANPTHCVSSIVDIPQLLLAEHA